MNIAQEPRSVRLPPPKKIGPYSWGNGDPGIEYGMGPYQICVRFGWRGPNSAMLQVCREDGGSVFDWRHLQEIKNAICGDEWEAAELFPAESRLKDPSNARYLWCKKEPFDFGLNGPRIVLDSCGSIAPQRPLALPCSAEGESR